MRMLNYSNETNPFFRGAYELNTSTELKSTPNHTRDQRVKGRIGLDKLLLAEKVQVKKHDNSGTHEESLSKKSPGKDTEKNDDRSKKPLQKVLIDPPSTVFATLADMNFTDASTISDDVCSVLTNYSSDSLFKQKTHTPKTSKLEKLHIKSTSHRRVDRTHRRKFSKIRTNTELVKGKSTLQEALTRRRNIVDGENIINEHCQRPHSVEREKIATFTKVTHMENSNKMISKCINQSKPHDFMTIRSKLKKVSSVTKPIIKETKGSFSVHVDSSISSRGQTTRSAETISIVESSSPSKDENNDAEDREEKQSHKSSNATTTTTLSISTSGTRSSASLETSALSKHFKSQYDPVNHKSYMNSTSVENCVSIVRGRIEDDRNDVENSQRSSDCKIENLREDEDTSILCSSKNSSKYDVMPKMGSPREAIMKILQREEKGPLIINFKREMSMNSQTERTGGNDDTAPPLKEDPEYNKYFKMLKMGLPPGAVKNALQRDGKDASIIDLDPDKSLKSQVKDKSMHRNEIVPSELLKDESTANGKGNETKKQKDNFRRTRLHWNILKNLSDKSIWHAIKKDTDIVNLQIDELEFKALFQSKEVPKPRRRTMVKDSDTENAVKAIDPKRANNGGITLARLKMSYDDIALAINSMDVSNLSAQQLSGIIEFLPTIEERRALKNYITKENDKLLCECEKFMLAMMSVTDASKKTETMLFMLQFPVFISEIRSEINIKVKACEELISSVRLRKILGIVLKVGNRLNKAGVEDEIESDSTNDANGFSVESLSKLNQVKACDKKTTLLSYIGSLILRSNRSLLNVKDDLPHVFKAQSVTSDHERSLDSLEKKLASARFISQSNEKASDCDNAVDDDADDNDGEDNNGEDNDGDDDSTNSFHLKKFILEASQSLNAARKANEEAETKLMSVFEYFSIETIENDVKANTLFGIVASFCKEINSIDANSARFGKKKHFLRIAEETRGVSNGSHLRSKAKGLRNNNLYVPMRE